MDKDQMTLTFLQNYLGLMKIPVTWRTNVKDELFVYALTQNLSPPAQSFVSLIAETYLHVMWDYIIRATILTYCEVRDICLLTDQELVSSFRKIHRKNPFI